MAQNISNKQRQSTLSKELNKERKAGKPGEREAFAKSALELLSYGVPIGVVGNLSAKAATKLLTKYKKLPKGYKRVYRGEERTFSRSKKTLPDKDGSTMNAEALRGRYFFDNAANARYYARQLGTRHGKVYSTDLPKKQFDIGKKITKRRTGAKLPGELTIPKLYVGTQTLNKGQTFRANMEGLVDTIKRPFELANDINKSRATLEGAKQFYKYSKDAAKAVKANKKRVYPDYKKGGVVKKRATSKRVNVTRGDGIAKRGKTRGRMV